MGLWSIQQILQRHGGSIQVESHLGEGTTFNLWWPKSYKAANRK
jgi:signal transduction histidine kinase